MKNKASPNVFRLLNDSSTSFAEDEISSMCGVIQRNVRWGLIHLPQHSWRRSPLEGNIMHNQSVFHFFLPLPVWFLTLMSRYHDNMIICFQKFSANISVIALQLIWCIRPISYSYKRFLCPIVLEPLTVGIPGYRLLQK